MYACSVGQPRKRLKIPIIAFLTAMNMVDARTCRTTTREQTNRLLRARLEHRDVLPGVELTYLGTV